VVTHAVLGPGGIGGLIGGLLARAGRDVTFIVRPGQAASYPRSVHVESVIYGEFDAAIQVTEQLGVPVDVLWVTCKATQLQQAIGAAPPDQVAGAAVVPLLNGLDHIAFLRRAYGDDSVLVGMIRTESTRVAPGRIVHGGWHVPDVTDEDDTETTAPLELAGNEAAPRLVSTVADELTAAGIRHRVRADENRVIWEKLTVVAPYALATTAVAGSIGTVRANADVLAHLRSAARETIDVAAALGVRLDRDELLAALDRYPDSMRVSMERDLAAGRELELANVAYPVIREGRALGLDMTSMEWLLERARAQVMAR
jgi:2-dehydropantoate 2-reductase